MENLTQQQRDERTWGMFCHLSALAMFILPVLGSIIGPIIVWSIKRYEYPFVDDQGKEAINFNLSMALYSFIAGIFVIILIGIGLLIAIGIFQVVMIIIASIKANSGERFRYPLIIRFLN